MSLGTIKTLLYVITVHIVMLDGDFGFRMDRHERFGVSRDLLLSLRCAALRLPENVCQKQLGCARRGCRAGRLVQVRRRRAAMTYIETNDDDGRKIPVLTSQRTVNKDDLLYRNSQRNTRHCSLTPITTSDSCQSNHTVERRFDGRSLLPTYYLLNPTSIAKNDTFDQIKVDIASLNVDVLLLCEAWLNQRHSDSMFAIDEYRIFRLDRRRRVGGGLCVYVSNTYDSCLYKFDSTRTARLPADIELMWIHVTSRLSGDVEHVVGLCYHPPKPLYQSTLLIDTIKQDLDTITHQNPNALIIFAGDLNQLNVTWLSQECGMTMINRDITHGSKILDRCFCFCAIYLLLHDI